MGRSSEIVKTESIWSKDHVFNVSILRPMGGPSFDHVGTIFGPKILPDKQEL